MQLLRKEINEVNREYYIEKVNEPLVKAIQILAMRYPDPRKMKLCGTDAKRWLEILDKYLEYEGNERLRRLVTAMFRIIIDKIEHSPNYRDRLRFILELASEGMMTRPYGHPLHEWNEPVPYGGGI